MKEISKEYGISLGTLYELIKTDPTFPYINVGVKKKYAIDPEAFESWLENRSRSHQRGEFLVFSGEELLRRVRRHEND